jgi:hypothetical protein
VLAVSSAIDTAGNVIQYCYNQNHLGNYDIASIKYTGHGTVDDDGHLKVDSQPFASVDFTYTDTVRALQSYIAGEEIIRDVRLETISSSLASRPHDPVAKYVLDYEDRNTSNRFVLTKLHYFGSDGLELQPTSFKYSQPSLGWKEAPYSFPSSAVLAGKERLEAGYKFTHFAPTGKLPDLLFAAQIDGKLESFAFRNDLDAADPDNRKWVPLDGFKPPIPFTDSGGADLGVIVADVAGSGRAAILQAYQQTGQPPVSATYLAGSSGFQISDGYKLPFIVSVDGKRVAEFRFANFTQPSRPDILYQSQGKSGLAKNTGTGWDPDPTFKPPFDISNRLIIIDIDCSGKPALLYSVPVAGGKYEWRIYRFDAKDGWIPELASKFVPLFPAATDPGAIKQINFDASVSKCPGLIVSSKRDGGTRAAYVTSANGWTKLSDSHAPPFDLVDANGNSSDAVVADVKGDGLPGVIANKELADGTSIVFAWLQTADGWAQSPGFNPPLLATDRTGATQPNVFIGDIDGLFGADIISVNDLRMAFSEPLGPKWRAATNDGELVDQPGRFGNDTAASKRAYEDGMAAVFSKCHAALQPEGRLVIVFANKNRNAWETLVSALIRAGFLVDGSWPIQTERGARTNAITTASLASSVWLVCKKRPAARPGWDTSVLNEMRDRIHTQLRAFWDAGIRGPDLVWAATGPALEAFSKYPIVKKADEPNAQMSVSEFLRQVRRLVVDFVVGRVLTHGEATEMAASLDDVTTYYLLHRNDFGLDDAPIGACILYALSCNLSDGDLADRFDILSRTGGTLFDDLEESDDGDGEQDDDAAEGDTEASGKGNKVRIKAWNQRKGKTLGYEAAGGRPVPLIDQAHRLMHLWRAGDEAKVDEYLETRGLKRSALFAQLLQALIELSATGSEERSILESLSNHIASRGGISAPRQIGMEV